MLRWKKVSHNLRLVSVSGWVHRIAYIYIYIIYFGQSTSLGWQLFTFHLCGINRGSQQFGQGFGIFLKRSTFSPLHLHQMPWRALPLLFNDILKWGIIVGNVMAFGLLWSWPKKKRGKKYNALTFSVCVCCHCHCLTLPFMVCEEGRGKSILEF